MRSKGYLPKLIPKDRKPKIHHYISIFKSSVSSAPINGNKNAIDKIRDRLWAVAGAGGLTGTLAAVILKVISN